MSNPNDKTAEDDAALRARSMADAAHQSAQRLADPVHHSTDARMPGFSPPVSHAADPAPPHDDFALKTKKAVRAALAAQPHRGSPGFDDLKAVADTIIDALTAKLRG